MADVFSFVHVDTEKKAQAAVSAHARGDKRPDSALTRTEWAHRSVVPIHEDRDRAEAVTREVRRAPARRGRPGFERVRLLIGHPPQFEADDAWSRAKLLDWARQSTAWVVKGVERASGGTAVVASSYLHVDELRPHLHVEVVPAMRDPKNPDGHLRMSWERMQRVWGGAPGRAGLSNLQTLYHRDVGAAFGMRRGEPSDRRRVATDDSDALKTRVRLLEAQRDRERARLSAERTDRLQSEVVMRSRIAKLEHAKRRDRDRQKERDKEWRR